MESDPNEMGYGPIEARNIPIRDVLFLLRAHYNGEFRSNTVKLWSETRRFGIFRVSCSVSHKKFCSVRNKNLTPSLTARRREALLTGIDDKRITEKISSEQKLVLKMLSLNQVYRNSSFQMPHTQLQFYNRPPLKISGLHFYPGKTHHGPL